MRRIALSCIAGLGLFVQAMSAAPPPPPPQQQQQDDAKRRFPRVRLGGIMVNAGYSHWSGGGWGPGYWGGGGPYWGGPMFWGPSMWGPMWGPAWGPMWGSPWLYSGFGWSANRGEVKLTSAAKTAEVYIDGAYAGTAGELKSMWLDPGVYTIEVKEESSPSAAFSKKVYVLSGKTLRLGVR